ncbi:MAG: hypothetical protein AAF620_13630 [Bacteroidota bacterium]
MLPIKKIIFVASVVLISSISYGHSPTEISFRFTEENQKKYLQVHLTSITLFDMLYHLKPELKSRESLNLNHFTADYEAYFNQHIDLHLNGQDQVLEYVESNLIIHDASIKFLIQDFEEEINEYEMSIGGFDFYSKPSFTVLFDTEKVIDVHFLSKEDNTCSNVRSGIASEDERGGLLMCVSIIIGVPLLILVGIFRNRMVSLLNV